MICNNCKQFIPDNSTVCPNCGKRLESFQSAQNNNSNKGLNTALIIFVIVLAVAVIVGGFIIVLAFNRQNDSKEASSKTASVETTVQAEPTTDPVSLNKIIAETTVDKKVLVPDVVGLNSDDAIKYLTAAGFSYEIVLSDSSSVKPDYVISQSPQGNKSSEKGTKVRINVAKRTASQASENTDYDITLYCCASDYVTLRDTPSRTGKALAKITTRESVKFYSTYGEFYYISYNGQKGYALGEFFSTDINAPLNYDDGNVVTSSDNYLYCRASDYATLRSGASRSSSEITKIYRREQVTYVSSSGEFYYVKYNGKAGYVLKNYFSSDKNAPLNYGDN